MIKRTDVERFVQFVIDNAQQGFVDGDDADEIFKNCCDEVQASLEFVNAPIQRKRVALVEYMNEDPAIRERLFDSVSDYLPSNYSAEPCLEGIVIEGYDKAGWTLDGYVIPRLASGLIVATEVK